MPFRTSLKIQIINVWLKTGKGIYGADPFVIALAKVEDLIVVTGERATNNLAKPKIPDVCNDMGIECINILDLMRREGWQF